MYNEEKLINAVSTIQETCLNDLNKVEKALTITNLLLTISKEFLPENLQANATDLLANGRRVNYELNTKHEDTGLLLAYYTHHLLATINNYLEKEVDE